MPLPSQHPHPPPPPPPPPPPHPSLPYPTPPPPPPPPPPSYHPSPPSPPSPSTTAAAMSLGTLAAAASLAAAAPSHHSPYYYHQQPYLRPNPPYSPPLHPQNHPQNHPQSHPQSHPQNHPPMVPAPAMSQMTRPKPSATPVAPAPSNHHHHHHQPHTTPPPKPKQRRYRATPEQLDHLIARFDLNPSPSSTELQQLAAKINMPAQSAVLWFKNRRARVPHKKDKADKRRREKDHTDIILPIHSQSIHSHPIHSQPIHSPTIHSPPIHSPPIHSPHIHSPHIHSPHIHSPHIHSPHIHSPHIHSPHSPHASNSVAAEVAAAASMAEMAMALSAITHNPMSTDRPLVDRNSVVQNTLQEPQKTEQTEKLQKPHLPRRPSQIVHNIPSRTSTSTPPPPLYRNRNCDAVPFDTALVSRLSSNVANTSNGAQFTTATPRRPRIVPPTPRLLSQRHYHRGDKVEVMETRKGICRAWYSAMILGRAEMNGAPIKDISLGQSAASVAGTHISSGVARQVVVKDAAYSQAGQDGDGGDSPRTVRSPVPSPTPPSAKICYRVRYDDRYEHGTETNVEEEVIASKIRPAPPLYDDVEPNWRPEAGEAVEVLRDGTWFVAVVQTFAVRKGYMVSFESGDVQWVRRNGIRPYQIWRGGKMWVTKRKPPLPVVRKSVGLSVTHPPGGKRKRCSTENGTGSGNGKEYRETRGRSKRQKCMGIDSSGPDGLPGGWRIDYTGMRRVVARRGTGPGTGTSYIAPDGMRLRSLKEAQRYVKMMGPG